jgi:hypothetical protein
MNKESIPRKLILFSLHVRPDWNVPWHQDIQGTASPQNTEQTTRRLVDIFRRAP